MKISKQTDDENSKQLLKDWYSLSVVKLWFPSYIKWNIISSIYSKHIVYTYWHILKTRFNIYTKSVTMYMNFILKNCVKFSLRYLHKMVPFDFITPSFYDGLYIILDKRMDIIIKF